MHLGHLVSDAHPCTLRTCRRWLAASKEDAASLPKAALACRLCKGVLMLGPASLRQHLHSKRHLARQKRRAEDYEPVILAIGSQVETTSTPSTKWSLLWLQGLFKARRLNCCSYILCSRRAAVVRSFPHTFQFHEEHPSQSDASVLILQ